LAVDSNNSVYVVGRIVDGSGFSWIVRKSTDGSSGSFSYVDDFKRDYNLGADTARDILITSENNIYVCGVGSGKKGIVRNGKLTSNSASLGPKMLARSINYVQEEISGSTIEKWKLNNISEFPHSDGLFQIPNLVLGTLDSGKIGKDDDAIVQVMHYGSVVYVMWPKQDEESHIKGYADSSVGSRPGKLTTDWSPGEWYDVTQYDHLTLSNYLTKPLSGTMDSVLIKIERKPLKDLGPTTEQVVEMEKSGSYVEAIHRDLILRRDIDYGNTNIKEDSWSSDIPLTNTKEIRISCRQKNGQTADENKNFISWGRLIKSEEET